MKSGNRSNALLVELLIVVMFFMLAATILMQVFSAAHQQTARAGVEIEALNDAQNIADRLYASEDREAVLNEMGFAARDDAWSLDREDYTIRVTESTEDTDVGTLNRAEVTVTWDDDVLLTLPVVHYEEGRA